MGITSSIWVDKYRPKEIKDLVFSEGQERDFIKYINDGEIPHLLLFGPPGSGKCHDGEEYIEIYVEDD